MQQGEMKHLGKEWMNIIVKEKLKILKSNSNNNFSKDGRRKNNDSGRIV